MLTVLRQRNFALVWLGGLASLTGDWALFAGLPLVVYQMTGSTLALGLTAIASSAPRLLLGSIAGVFVDRWDRRQIMLVADLLLGLALLPLLLVTSVDRLWLLVACVIVESSIVQFYKPAEGALLPRLVAPEDLVAANALNGLNMNIARLAGPAIGALLVSLSGISGVVLVDSGSFFLAGLALLLVRVDARAGPAAASRQPGSAPLREPPNGSGPRSAPLREAPSQPGSAPLREEPSQPGSAPLREAPSQPGSARLREALRGAGVASVWREWLAGLSLVRTELTPRVIFIFLAVTGLGEGIMATLFVAFATNVLQGGQFAFAALISAQAIGGLLGGLALGHFGRRIAPALLLGGGALLGGVIDLLIFYSPVYAPSVTPSLLIPVVLMIVVGGPFAAINAGYMTLAQTTVADAFRGRLLGLFLAVRALSEIIGMGLGGVLGDPLGIIQMLTLDSVAYAIAGGMVLIVLASRRVGASAFEGKAR